MRGWRMQAALEAVRQQLNPMFTYLEDTENISRTQVAAMWRFSITDAVLSYLWTQTRDAVPIPFDIIRNPDTGRVELPFSTSDRPLERDAKLQANRLDGFSVSADMLFDSTGPIDPNSVNTDTIQLWDIDKHQYKCPSACASWRKVARPHAGKRPSAMHADTL